MEYRISRHAEDELVIRSIPRSMLENVMSSPEQIVNVESGLQVLQSRVGPFGMHRQTMLLRAIVDTKNDPNVVITVYLTSKIERYWQK
jgi:hypothetical protein